MVIDCTLGTEGLPRDARRLGRWGGGAGGMGWVCRLLSLLGCRTLGTRGFSRVQRECSVLAESRHIFGRRPNSRAAKPREKPHKDLTETGNRARKVSGTQGRVVGEER